MPASKSPTSASGGLPFGRLDRSASVRSASPGSDRAPFVGRVERVRDLALGRLVDPEGWPRARSAAFRGGHPGWAARSPASLPLSAARAMRKHRRSTGPRSPRFRGLDRESGRARRSSVLTDVKPGTSVSSELTSLAPQESQVTSSSERGRDHPRAPGERDEKAGRAQPRASSTPGRARRPAPLRRASRQRLLGRGRSPHYLTACRSSGRRSTTRHSARRCPGGRRPNRRGTSSVRPA